MRMMFAFDKEQKVAEFAGVRFGGQPGENPPLLIGSMFQKGDKMLESRKGGKFDKAKATEYIKTMERLSEDTGVPGMVAMVANSAEEMKRYLDFYTSVTDMPFGVDIWVLKPRLESAEYVASLGLQDRLLYNSITPWSEDPEGEIERMRELGIKNVLLQVFDDQDQSAQGRITSLMALMDRIEDGGFTNVIVDTSVMNLPALSFSLWANRYVKEQTGLPAGVATANGTYMWKTAREQWGREGFVGIDAGAHALSAALWSDFIFYGPMTGTERIFPAVATASTMLATLAYEETQKLPEREDHPIYRFFGEFAQQIVEGGARK